MSTSTAAKGSPVGPVFNKTTFYIPNIIFFVLSVLFVVLRICSRRIQRLRLDASDYCILIALAFSILVSVAAYIGVENGAGEHTAYLLHLDPTGGKVVFLLKDLMLATIPYLMSLAFSRLSILLLYRAIFQTPFMRISSVLLGVLVSLIAISAMLTTVFSCHPVEGFWLVHTMNPPPKCLNTPVLYEAVGVLTILMDIACLALPIWDIVQLKLSRRDKAIVLALFFMGGLTIVVSIPRTVVVGQGDDNDISYWLASIALWSSIETAVAIVCVCLPVLRPVVRRLGVAFGWTRHVRELTGLHPRSGSNPSRSAGDDPERERSLHHPGTPTPAQLDALFPEIDVELEKARDKVLAKGFAQKYSMKAADKDYGRKVPVSKGQDVMMHGPVVVVGPVPKRPDGRSQWHDNDARRGDHSVALAPAARPTGRRKETQAWEQDRARMPPHVRSAREMDAASNDRRGAADRRNERPGFF